MRNSLGLLKIFAEGEKGKVYSQEEVEKNMNAKFENIKEYGRNRPYRI